MKQGWQPSTELLVRRLVTDVLMRHLLIMGLSVALNWDEQLPVPLGHGAQRERPWGAQALPQFPPQLLWGGSGSMQHSHPAKGAPIKALFWEETVLEGNWWAWGCVLCPHPMPGAAGMRGPRCAPAAQPCVPYPPLSSPQIPMGNHAQEPQPLLTPTLWGFGVLGEGGGLRGTHGVVTPGGPMCFVPAPPQQLSPEVGVPMG